MLPDAAALLGTNTFYGWGITPHHGIGMPVAQFHAPHYAGSAVTMTETLLPLPLPPLPSSILTANNLRLHKVASLPVSRCFLLCLAIAATLVAAPVAAVTPCPSNSVTAAGGLCECPSRATCTSSAGGCRDEGVFPQDCEDCSCQLRQWARRLLLPAVPPSLPPPSSPTLRFVAFKKPSTHLWNLEVARHGPLFGAR